jgi:uncharacterized membrane protein YdbT with pleckstrin-like domain
MLCPHCNTELVRDALFCHHCGERLDGHSRADASLSDTERLKELAGAATATGAADDPMRELWRGGYSTQAMLPTWVVTGLITLAVLIGAIVLSTKTSLGKWWLVLLAALAILWLYQAASLFYRRWNVRYVLTPQRFICETGILRRVSDRLEVVQIDDVTFEQGLLDRLTGTGTIRISSADRSHPELTLRGIQNVQHVAEMIDEARRVERVRRSVRVEQI